MIARGLVDAVLAPGARRAIAQLLADRLRGVDSGVVVDVGCGPAPRHVAAGVIGVDVDETAARRYRRHAAAIVAEAAALPFPDGSAAAVISVGLLHHLPDGAAAAAIAEMTRIARPRAPVVIFDGVLPHGPRVALPRAIRRLDRGRHHRPFDALAALLDAVASWDKKRVTYAATGLEAMVAICRSRG
jgi:SAM-dependent methyltransferase